MFTGIIEAIGSIQSVTDQDTNRSFWIQTPLAQQFKVDQSIAHNGVCLTVEAIENENYKVTAVKETLQKTTLSTWKVGDAVNLERSLLPTSRLDGHFVQGHVDATGVCQRIEDMGGSYEIMIGFPGSFAALVIEKGSISVNGVSLTAFDVTNDTFKVAIIPYTWEHTNLHLLSERNLVNLEFDMIGKYITRKNAVNTSITL